MIAIVGRVKEALKAEGVDYNSLDFIPDFEEVDGEVFPSYEIILYWDKYTLSCLFRRDYLERNPVGFARAVKNTIAMKDEDMVSQTIKQYIPPERG